MTDETITLEIIDFVWAISSIWLQQLMFFERKYKTEVYILNKAKVFENLKESRSPITYSTTICTWIYFPMKKQLAFRTSTVIGVCSFSIGNKNWRQDDSLEKVYLDLHKELELTEIGNFLHN